jgi:hypothetical protein
LLGFLRVEERKKGPGLKPLDSARVIQGAEAPCSLRKDKGKGGEQATARVGSLWGERGKS